MIHFLKGDIFESKAQALVNTVNTVGVMGKGIALQFKERYPDNFNSYKKACKDKIVRPGTMFITEGNNLFGQSKTIINFPTKTHWRKPSEYIYITEGLQDLRKEIIKRKIKSIAIPPLGTNNGGLDWEIVKSLMVEALTDIDSDIYIYEPNSKIKEQMKEERVKLTPARAMLILMFSEMVKEGEFVSLFAAEKLVYFLQKFGAKEYFNIDFEPYYYGPYSGGKIAHVLHRLNGSYISGMSTMNNEPLEILWLEKDAEKDARLFLESIGNRKVWDILHKTSAFLSGYYCSLGLELLSTVDFILNSSPTLYNWKNLEETEIQKTVREGLNKWGTRKAKIMTPEFVSQAISHLKKF